MATKKKSLPVKLVGKNVRISNKSHELLSTYCKDKGYNLGAFCEIGALAKMQGEVLQNS